MPPPRHNRIVERDYGFFNIIRYYGIRTVRSIQKIFSYTGDRVNNWHSEQSAESIRLLPASGASVLSLYSRSELTPLFNYSYHKRSAFTLAEVLITLGIIGIVAALTMPSLIANYQEKVLVAAAKRSYSTITNAVNMWSEKKGTYGNYEYFWTYNDNADDLLKELATVLNATNVCTFKNFNECGGTYQVKQAKKRNDGHGNTDVSEMQNWNRAVLADGTFISIVSQVQNGSCTYTFFKYETDANGNYIKDESSPTGYKGEYGTGYTCGYIGVDTNGKKGPNQVGLDYFLIGYTASKPWSNSDNTGNLEYVLLHDKLIKTDKYTIGKFE